MKFLCVVALGLVLFDNLADALGCQDSPTATPTSCHACSCGTHITPQATASLIVVTPPPTAYDAYQPLIYALLLPDAAFRPPCLAT